MQVASSDVLKQYTYILLARKKIVATKTFSLPENETNTHTFSFLATVDMSPEVHVLVYTIKNNTICSRNRKIELKGVFRNSVVLSLSTKQARPGQEIAISIKTNPKSYVGMLGIDESLLLLKSGNDLDKSIILAEVYRIYQRASPYYQKSIYWKGFQV